MRGIKGAIRAGEDFEVLTALWATRHIEIQVLKSLAEHSYGGMFVYIRHITEDLNMDREYVRTALRALRNRGFATYARGLWTEDGEMAGAGYSITPAGRVALSSGGVSCPS